MKKIRAFKLFVLMVFAALTASARHYTVVISLDGFRWDYTEWYNTPFFDLMATEGVSSGLIPSYPSKTFPNHYALATGLYPDNHGIVANEFFRRGSCSLSRTPKPRPTRGFMAASRCGTRHTVRANVCRFSTGPGRTLR